jgi:hypothetical protein
VVHVVICVTQEQLFVCEECEASWRHERDILKAPFEDLGTVLENRDLPPLWSELAAAP